MADRYLVFLPSCFLRSILFRNPKKLRAFLSLFLPLSRLSQHEPNQKYAFTNGRASTGDEESRFYWDFFFKKTVAGPVADAVRGGWIFDTWLLSLHFIWRWLDWLLE
jgi:hypothetical protein